MSTPGIKKLLFEQLAAVSRALAHGHRLELIELLAQGERSVEALAEVSGLTLANASQHLQRLRRAGLVASRRDARHVRYRLADEAVMGLVEALRQIAERNVAEVGRLVETYLRAKDGMEPVTPGELLRMARKGQITVLDVRPPEEYAAGHLPNAVNIPLKELERRLKELPKGREVVAYCRGPYCVLAYEAVRELRSKGLRARRLAGGLPEWKHAGLPVEPAAAD